MENVMKNQDLRASPSPLHRLRIIASFALLGAVIAGSFEILPAVAAVIPGAFELQAIGAILGGIAGAAAQAMHQI
jgi:hypothetical protein